MLRHVKQRHQFGQPIGRFQALQHGLAETTTKLLATGTAEEAPLQGMQFMGGMGYSMESDMQSYVRDTLVMTIFGGTSQIQKNTIAGQLGLHD